MRELRICLVLEGCYPYVHGGVSTWMHQYITVMKEHQFVLWVIGAHACDRGKFVYELPDTVKQQRTEAQAYAAVWDIMMKLQKDLPRSFVYYGQDSLEDEGQRFDELGVFLPIHRFSERLEKSIDTVDKIVHAQA